MNVLNFAGDYVLIFGRFGAPAMGATGAAFRRPSHCSRRHHQFCTYLAPFPKGRLHESMPDKSVLMRIFKLGAPATRQEFFFSAGISYFFWLVGEIGTAEFAALNVLVRSRWSCRSLMAVGSASATLVARKRGRRRSCRARNGVGFGKIGFLLITLLGLPLVLFRNSSCRFSFPPTIEIAVISVATADSTAGWPA